MKARKIAKWTRVRAVGSWSAYSEYEAIVINRRGKKADSTWEVRFISGWVKNKPPQYIPESCLVVDELYYSPLNQAFRRF